MSIKVMSSVWDHSTQTGTALLMLLAIADNANEYGEAWPSVDTLAAKCRMGRRNAQKLLIQLSESGELVIGRQVGQSTKYGPTNLYTIITPGALRRDGVNPSTPHEPQYTPRTNGVNHNASHERQSIDGVNSSTGWGELQYQNGVNSSSPKPSVKPSLNHHHQPGAPAGANRGGGGEKRLRDDERDDEWIEDANDPEDSQEDEADCANVREDLVDQLVTLGVRPGSARKAVEDGTVASDRDVVLCKRYIVSSTANSPAAVLWMQYLSLGRLPPAPYSDTTTVTLGQRMLAERYARESEEKNAVADQFVGLAALQAAMDPAQLKSMNKRPAPVVHAERRFGR